MITNRLKEQIPKSIVLPVSIFFIALIVRLIFLLLSSDKSVFLSPGGDAEIYVKMAEEFINGSWRNEPFFRAPGYPVLIVLLSKITGGDFFWPIRILQIVLSSFAASLLALTTRNWFGNRAGWISGLLWSCYGLSIYFDSEGLIASIFVSLLILLFYCFDIYLEKRTKAFLLISSILLGLMTLFRANALLFWPIILMFTFVPELPLRWKVKKENIFPAFISFVVMLMVISPALVHNTKTGSSPSVSVQGGINLYIGNHTVSEGAFAVDPDYGNDWTKDQIEFRAKTESGKQLNPSQVSKFYSKKAFSTILANPLEWLKLEFDKFLILFNRYELANNRVIYPYMAAVSPVFYFLLIIGYPIVLVFSVPFIFKAVSVQRRSLFLLLFGFIHILMLLLFFVNARYRFPLIPMLLPFAGYGLSFIIQNYRDILRFNKKNLFIYISIPLTVLLLFLPAHTTKSDEEASWLFHKGNAALRLGRYVEAKDALLNLTAVYPQYKNGFNNLGIVYLHQKQYEDAQVSFERELKYHPNNEKAIQNLGTLYEHQGLEEKAINHYRKALTLDQTLYDARYNLANIFSQKAIRDYQAGDLNSALDYCLTTLKYLPARPDFRLNYAVLLIESGQVDSAKTVLQNLIQKHPSYSPAKELLNQLKTR